MTTPINAVIGPAETIVVQVGGNPLPNGTVIGLMWDAATATYQPANRQADLSAQKFFTGPVNPTTLPGVVLAKYDQWIQTVN